MGKARTMIRVIRVSQPDGNGQPIRSEDRLLQGPKSTTS